MPNVESASMPVVVDYHHQVHMEDGYPSVASYPAEGHDASLYYHHQQQQQQMIADPSSMIDSSYNLPCDYNNSAGYCQPVIQADYPYQHYTSAAVPSVAPAPPCDAQSSGYYSSPVDAHHYSSHQHQMAESSSAAAAAAALMPPYDCYSSHDHLEKYQAAFVDALESHNTSMDTSAEGAATASNSSADLDPLQIHSGNVLQHLPTPEFQFEYETNYGNNEWTMTSGNYSAYPSAENYPADSVGTSESDMPALPNYCFAACVFTTPPSSEPASAKVEISTFSPSTMAATRHFESYDYQTLNEEPLHPALWAAFRVFRVSVE